MDRAVMVTGATRGIGFGVAKVALARGWKVAVCGTSEEGARAACQALGAGAAPVALRVEDRDAWGPALDAAEAAVGPLTALVANAGISPRRDGRKAEFASDGPEDEAFWRETFAVNVEGAIHGARALARRLVARGSPGSIVVMSSIAGQVGIPFVSSYYAASKAAVLGFVRAAAYDLGPHGIRINAIGPGRIESDMVRSSGREVNDAVAAITALGRLGTPEEVGEAAEFLISDRASFVTGTRLNVTGGWSEP